MLRLAGWCVNGTIPEIADNFYYAHMTRRLSYLPGDITSNSVCCLGILSHSWTRSVKYRVCFPVR